MNLELNLLIMDLSSRNSFGTAFTLGIGAGILLHTFFKKLPTPVKSTQWLQDRKSDSYVSVKQKIHYLKDASSNLIANPIPDLYKATESLTLSEDDLIHASE